MKKSLITGLVSLGLLLSACPTTDTRTGDTKDTTKKDTTTMAEKVVGVDQAQKIVYVGALNDESGPAVAIGKPYAIGKRVLAAQVNAGGSGILPDGWKVELVERDHGYNPQKSVQAYNEIKDKVLFIGTSFGTPNTLPLRPHLKRDNVVAFPASLSSEMAKHEHTPPLGPAYNIEAMRAMDWVVDKAGSADKVKAAIIYQQDDYGKDGLDGWKAAAKHHSVTVVSEQKVAPGQKDMTAVIASLKKAGATHVLLTTLPSATGPIVGTAAKMKYMPVWIGNTPAWVDVFFNPKVIPSEVFGNFYWVSGVTYWGEDVPGMKKFVTAYETYAATHKGTTPDFYVFASYVQGLAQLEAAKRTIASGDFTRTSYKKNVQSLKNWNGGGLFQPIDLSSFPYVTGTRTRVLKPNFKAKSWDVVADYAEPKAYEKGTTLGAR